MLNPIYGIHSVNKETKYIFEVISLIIILTNRCHTGIFVCSVRRVTDKEMLCLAAVPCLLLATQFVGL